MTNIKSIKTLTPPPRPSATKINQEPVVSLVFYSFPLSFPPAEEGQQIPVPPQIEGEHLFLQCTWPDFPSEAFVGSEPQQAGSPTSEPLADSFAIEVKSAEVCQWNADNSSLIFLKEGNCILTVTATKAGYANKSEDFSVMVGLAQVSVEDWGTFDPVTVGEAATAPPSLTDMEPNDATPAWTSATESICEVDPVSGFVTGLDAGDCQVRLTLSRDQRSPVSHDYSFTVNAGTIVISGWGTYDPVTVGAAVPFPLQTWEDSPFPILQKTTLQQQEPSVMWIPQQVK